MLSVLLETCTEKTLVTIVAMRQWTTMALLPLKDFLRAWVKNVPMLSVVSSEAQFPQAFHISAGLPSGLSHRHSLRGILPDH